MDSIKNVSQALVKCQAAFPTIAFDSTNPHFKSKFASLTAIVSGTKQALSDNGLCITHSIKGMSLITRLVHSSGEYLESEIPLVLSKNDMQGLGSAITYAKRYGMSAVLNIVSDADDDGNAATGVKPTEQSTATQKPEAPKSLPPTKNAPAAPKPVPPKLGEAPKKAIPKWSAPPDGAPIAPAFDEFKPAFDTSFNFGANEDKVL